MATATSFNPVKSFCFAVDLKIGKVQSRYSTNDATVTWDSNKSKTRLRFSSAVPEEGHSESAKIFSEIDCANQCAQITIQAMTRDGGDLKGPGTITVDLPVSPIMALSRTYKADENSYLMDTLTLELYGGESPF